MECNENRVSPRLAAVGLLMGLGLLLGALSWLSVYPARTLATWVSADGVLSESYILLIQTSQNRLALSCVLAALLFGWMEVGRVTERLSRVPFRTMAAAMGVLSLVLAVGVQEWLFDSIPHVTDATSHLFQAKILALGRWFAPAPECPEAFWQPHVVITRSGKWFSKYTPGHPLLLAAGMKLGLLKWVVPLCLAGTVVFFGKFLNKYEGRLFAFAGMLFFALSPLALLLGGSYMSHVTALFLGISGLYFWVTGIQAGSRAGRRVRILFGGLLLAGCAATRPHEFVLMGGMGLVYSVSFSREEWGKAMKSLPWLLLGTLPVAAVWLHWNAVLYGNPFALGYGFTTNDAIRPAFQGSLGFSSSFGLKEALALLCWNLDRTNGSFLGWSVSWLFVPFALFGLRKRLLFLSMVGLSVVMGFYFFYDYRSEYEARYYYLALPFFIYLSVRGMRNLVRLGRSARSRRTAAQSVFLVCLSFFLYAGIYYWPVYLIPRYENAYEESSATVEARARELRLDRALVLIAPDEDGSSFFYSSGFIYNDPLLERDVIYARAMPERIPCLREAFPDRVFYRYENRGGRDDTLERMD